MDGVIFDSVKYEKAKAMARFKRFQRIKKLWKVLVIVMLLSWTSKNFPATVKFSGILLLNPHVVFLIGNTIIVVLFLLCRKSVVGNISGDVDLYDDYARHSEAQRPVALDSESELETEEKEKSAAEDESGMKAEEKEMQIVVAEDESGMKAEEKEMQIVVAENEQCEAVETAIAKATEQIRRFERTQSEKLRREIAVRPRREFRRSETEIRRQLVFSSGHKTRMVTSSFDTVENLSNEEFKLTIDAFIDKHREFFYVQKMQELKQLKSV